MGTNRVVQRFLRLRQGLGQGEVSLFDVARYAFDRVRYELLRRYGFPSLLLQWPVTIWRLFRALFGRCEGSVYALTSFDMWLRTYYSKLARNFKEAGRFGYVWDEGMGIPMGPRFGSNYVTYLLYDALSPTSFSLFSLGLFLSLVVLTGFTLGNLALSVAVALLLAASPAILFSLVSYGIKPEVIWWSFSILVLVTASMNAWGLVWIMTGFLLLVNTSVSVIMGALLVGPWTWSLLHGHPFIEPSMVWLIPGLLARSFRMLCAYQEGWLNIFSNEQTRVVRRSSKISRFREVKRLGYSFLVPLLIACWGRWDIGLTLGSIPVVLYFLNRQLIKIMDTVSMRLLFLCSIVSAALLSGEWLSLLGVVLFAYADPAGYVLSGWVLGERKTNEFKKDVSVQSLVQRTDSYNNLLKDYPWFAPMSLPKPDVLIGMLDRIPSGSRILLEGDGDPRTESRYWCFHDWTNEFLPARKIELVNQTFLIKAVEPLLAGRYFDRFAIPDLPPSVMHQICSTLGVSFVITFTQETTDALQNLGYCCIMRVRYEDYAELADLLHMPHRDLALLANPESTSILSPCVAWSRDRNSISWQAKAGEAYVLRYRFHPCIEAMQGHVRLPVEPQTVFADLPLRFMRVRAEHDGPLTVRFVPRWV